MERDIDYVSVSDKENRDLIPEDLTLEQYWEANNEFLNAWDEGPSICLAYRSIYSSKKLIKRIEKFKWYFHVRAKEFKLLRPSIKNKIKKLANNIAVKMGTEFIKIYCNNMSINTRYDDRQDAKMKIINLLQNNGVEPLESDLSNYKRYCIDKHIKIAENFRIAFFDIETDDRQDGIIIGRDRILSFAYYDEKGRGSFSKLKEFDDKNEADLLLKIEKVLLDFDIIITWNGNNFDIPYIRERFIKILGRNMSLKTVAHIDFMKRFQKLFQSDVNIRSWSLNFISNYFLGDQKVDHTGYGMYDMWSLSFEDDPKTKSMFRAYNMHDCRLLYRLEEKLNILSLIIKECQWTGTFPSKFYVSELLDNYILRFSNPKGVHFKATSFSNIPKEERKKESDVKGGFVYDPDKGLHENVYVFDFKSLYPTIVMTFNISQDTFHYELPENANESDYIKTINGFYTDRDRMGMLPIVIDQLLEARKKYKAKQFEATYGTQEFEVAQGAQQVVKELANSLYGTMAQIGNRYYSKETAEAITLAGQHMNKYTGEILKRLHGYEVKYGDSVSSNTCIPIKLDGSVCIMSFKEMFEDFSEEIKKERGKEIIYPSEKIKALTGKGKWKKVVRIIRHETDKKLYDVYTPDGIVSATEDHSFYSNGKEVSPLSYPEKDRYTHEYKIDTVKRFKLEFTNKIKYLDDDKIDLDFKLGVVLGSYIRSGYGYSKYVTLYSGKENVESKKILKYSRECFGEKSIYVRRLRKKIEIELEDEYYADIVFGYCGRRIDEKFMPDFVFDTNMEFVRGIFVGYMSTSNIKKYYSEDMSSGYIQDRSRKFLSQVGFILKHYRDNNYHIRYCRNKSNGIFYIIFQDINRLGYVAMSNLANTKERMDFTRTEHTISKDGYVYDIEVEDDHTFVDAAGGAILHNTDSVFVHMPDSPDDKINDILADIHIEYVRHLSTDFNVKKSHIQLEYEKKFKRIILLHKKQYVGWLVEVDSKAVDKIYGRGIEYVKKDTIELARKLQLGMLNSLLKEDRDVDYYHNFVQEEKEKFLSGNFDVKDILINMKVSKRPDRYKVKQVHIRIAEKMIKDGKEFYVGSMIPFIITSSDNKLEGIHVDDFNGEYDRVYYWDIKIFSPLKRILSCVYPNEDWLQYEFDTIKKRNRKMEQFSRWLVDKSKAKRRDEYIERINNDAVLNEENKRELLSLLALEEKKRKDEELEKKRLASKAMKAKVKSKKEKEKAKLAKEKPKAIKKKKVVLKVIKKKKIILKRVKKKDMDDNGGHECQKKKSQESLNSKLRIRLRKPPQMKSE